MLRPYSVECPYCGENFETTIDTSAGDQDYVEDCYVCCQPINFCVTVDYDGNLRNVETRSDNE